jgi:hypothetical protein
MWWIAFDGSDDDESGLPIGGVAKVEDTYCID